MWFTGAASDALSELMGDDDGCCGGDPNDGGVGGCGKCLLVQNENSLRPEWTAVVMKKNRCPPHSYGCGAGEPHFDIAVPGFDNLDYSTANVCGLRPGTGFNSKEQSATLGSWWQHGCTNIAECIHLCDQLPARFIKGCKLFASWGWNRGDPTNVKYKAVTCPERLVEHMGAQFGPNGAEGGGEGPTPAPTPAPTLAPTPSPTTGLCKPWCSSNSKPWSTKCKWDKCAKCSGCELTPGQCKAWCATNAKDWSKKCLWEKCSGCPDCTSGARRLRGSKRNDEPISNEELLV